MARGLRDPDAARPHAQVGRRPRARLPPGGDGTRGAALRPPRRGGGVVPHRAVARPPRLPRPPGPRRAVARARPAPCRTDPRGRGGGRSGEGLPRLRRPAEGLRRLRRALAFRGAVRAAGGAGPAGLAGSAGPRPPAARGGARRGGPRLAPAGPGSEPPRPARPPRGLAHPARARPARPRRAALREHGGGVRPLRGPAHLHGLPLPRRRHAVALPPLPRVEHVRGGARVPAAGMR